LRTPLADALLDALEQGSTALTTLYGAQPTDRRDRFRTLLAIYDLHSAPLQALGESARHQGHPVVADLKSRLEDDWLAELDAAWVEAGHLAEADDPDRVVKAMRSVAVQDRLPAAYKWLAKDATWTQLVDFLALEGGPDGGFDDLVAACQIGLDGEAKLELAQNYWDEMGNGSLDAVHTELHRRLARALGITALPRTRQPLEGLERAALGSVLATNRHLQREMVGALGLIELQAGPRCRKVVAALKRLDAPVDALPFYEEHAVADPRHGKDWVDHVVATLGTDAGWADGMVRGARWRSLVNQRFFGAMAERFAPAEVAARRAS
jgi:hypothetical protein